MKQQKGFTLIELMVVIVILGVLAAVALPRFISATEDAHTAAVKGTGGALAAGVALVRSQWELNKAKGALDPANPNDDVQGFGANDVEVNAQGWPVGTNGANTAPTAPRCVQMWNALLQGSAPVVAAAGTAAAATADYEVAAGSLTGTDGCTFTYRLDGRASGQRTISYDAVTGAVTSSAN